MRPGTASLLRHTFTASGPFVLLGSVPRAVSRPAGAARPTPDLNSSGGSVQLGPHRQLSAGIRLAVIAASLVALLLALPAAADADATITSSCRVSGVSSPCSTGWYTATVTVSFSVSGSNLKKVDCPDATIDTDTASRDVSCTVTFTDNTITGKVVTIKRDATTPTVTAIAASRGPDSGGWYNHPVGVAAVGTDATSGIASCTTVGYSGPDSGSGSVTATCTDNAANVSAPKTLTLQYDATPPSVASTPARVADADGWYNHPVDVAFSGTDGVSGVDTCTSAAYAGPDNASASVSGSCRDKAGNTAVAGFALRYDSTPPSITGGTPDRAPDANGWYNHRLVVSFAGTDELSGIVSCDAPVYDKPNDPAATLTGRCRDNAGNLSAPASFALKFDSTPPKLTSLALNSLNRAVDLTWKGSADITTVKIVRTGGGSAATVTVYDGKRATVFSDKRVRNGRRYSYVLTAFDEAGNEATLKGHATPSAPLVAPREGARVRGGVMLRWRAVPKASYYNVQLWLRGTKVLTIWPGGQSLRVPHLGPGSYSWYVWPGIGPRSRHRYGALLGRGTFIVIS
jgi:hypothetical protein